MTEHEPDIPEADGDDGALPATGEPRVDQAVALLAELENLPVSEHPQVFERVHGELVEVLEEKG